MQSKKWLSLFTALLLVVQSAVVLTGAEEPAVSPADVSAEPGAAVVYEAEETAAAEPGTSSTASAMAAATASGLYITDSYVNPLYEGLTVGELPADTAESGFRLMTEEADVVFHDTAEEAAEVLLPEWSETMDRFTQSAEHLKRTSYQFADFAYDEDAPVLWAAVSTYDAPVRMQVTVSNYKPALYETLLNTEPNDMDGKAVYIGRDDALGDSFAVWEEGGERYVQIRFTGAGDDDIRKGIEEILKLSFESIAESGKES